MKNHLFIFLLTLLVPTTATAQYRGENLSRDSFSGAVVVQPVEINRSSDSLTVEIEVLVLSEAMNKRQRWTVIPQLTSKDSRSSATFPHMVFNGKMKSKHYRRQHRYGNLALFTANTAYRTDVTPLTNTSFRYSATVARESWMDNSVFSIQQILTSSAGKRQLFAVDVDCAGILNGNAYSFRPKVNYVREITSPELIGVVHQARGEAYLDYRQGRSEVDMLYGENASELSKLQSMMDQIRSGQGEIKRFHIVGYASPEGTYASNDRLSSARAQSFMHYVRDRYYLPGHVFSVSHVPEDWNGLRKIVEDSHIDYKRQILEIIDLVDIFQGRESKLMALGGGHPYRTMLRDMFPKLRRVEYVIDYTHQSTEVAEIPAVSPNAELLQKAMAMADPKQKAVLLRLLSDTYPQEIPTAINAAAALLEDGDLDTAFSYLLRAGDDPRADNNYGVYWLLKGDAATAAGYLRKAVAAGIPEAVENLTELYRR